MLLKKYFSLFVSVLRGLGFGGWIYVCFVASTASANCFNPKSGERLTNFCLLERSKGREVSNDFAQFFDYRLKQSGYANGVGLSGRAKPITVRLQAAPVVYYSSNINGGNPNTAFILGGLDFSGDPKLVLKKGMLFGATAGLSGRNIYAEGRYLDFGLSTSYAHSPNHRIGVTDLDIGFCSKNHIKYFWHIDFCGSSSRAIKKIVDDTNRNISVHVSKLFSLTPNIHHEAGLGFNLKSLKNYKQDQIHLNLETITSSGILSKFKISFGERIQNNVASKHSLDWSLSKAWEHKNFMLSGNFNKFWDSKLFGQPRQELSKSITLNYGFGNGVSVGIGVTATDSNINYFRSTSPIFYANFSTVKF